LSWNPAGRQAAGQDTDKEGKTRTIEMPAMRLDTTLSFDGAALAIVWEAEATPAVGTESKDA
jgi:hypothetical protein